MRKILLSLTVIVAFIFYSLHQRKESGDVRVIAPSQASPTPMASGSSPEPTTPIGTVSAYKDGKFTGDTADAFYGNMQVQITISGGKIVDVQFLQYPNDRTTSVMINTQAMPYLKSEAIQAQSANVAVVSGASASSQAFVQSLQSALDKAKI